MQFSFLPGTRAAYIYELSHEEELFFRNM